MQSLLNVYKTGHLHLTYVFPIIVVVWALGSQSLSPGSEATR